MKIVQIMTRVNSGGTARWLENLTVGLKADGHEVIILAGEVPSNEIEDKFFIESNGIRIPGLGRSVSPLEDLRAFFHIRKNLKMLKPDVINTHTSKAGVLGRVAALSLGRNSPRIVHTFHGHLLYGYFSKLTISVITIIERFLARHSDQLISSGEIVRDELLNRKIGKSNKFVVIRPGIPSPIFENRKTARESFLISEDTIVVGWLGRMEKIKRPDRLIRIANSNQEITFLAGGSGSELEKSKADAPANVIFAGWSTPEVIWGASDIALLTSDNEAQPISLIEAGLAGIPSISTKVGSVAEVINDGQTGFICASENDIQLRLNDLINSKDLRLKLGGAARSEMLTKFSLNQFVATHIDAYKKLKK